MFSNVIVDALFDKIYVVSLPGSLDRRAYVTEHLNSIGLANFEFHDACDTGHPDVARFQNEGKVASYPPCFRCGKASCGREDCNNVLIPAQIATFASYLRLWEKIAATPQRALVLEDDIFFHPHWQDVLGQLKGEIAAGRLAFQPDVATLLRLGWALNEEHKPEVPFSLSDAVKMSNPCHALTSAFAQRALDRFVSINTTPDVYLHRDCPQAGEAFTVFPPIASELSWSVGKFQSLIHPKEIRARYLEQQGDVAAAEAQRIKVKGHRMHKFHRSILVTGHPRTGTGYSANLLGQMGLDVGHEKDGRDGLSSWMFAADAQEYPYAQDAVARSRDTLHWDVLVHPLRDIATAVPSVMRDNIHAPPSYKFRRTQILADSGIDLDGFDSNFERAVVSLICWTRMVQKMKPDIWFRVEDGQDDLRRFLLARGLIGADKGQALVTDPVNAEKLYQGKHYPKPVVSAQDWQSLSPETKTSVAWYCNTFGYPLPPLEAQEAGTKNDGLPHMQGLDRLFLEPSGWSRSRREQRPVRADGRPLPWFTFGAIEFLHRVVPPDATVFEYGAGYSTLWWQRAAEVHSVDHDPEWVAELKDQLQGNVTLNLVEQDAPPPDGSRQVFEQFLTRNRRVTWDYDAAKVVRRGLDDDRFLAYAAHIQKSGKKFDFIVIDGMARRLCTAFAIRCLADKGMIILDNSNRSDYDAAFTILHEAGFRQIPFWGLVPGADFMTCTSVFLKDLDRLPDGRHGPNSFGLPEY